MNRENHENAVFFTGIEIERTPAYGRKTLFVVGIQPVDDILTQYNAENCTHIFFGANHSFCPGLNLPADADEWDDWEDMIKHFADLDILCTLDIPLTHAEAFLEGVLVEYNNFIPQIRVPLPYIKLWNYNTMIKLDDKDFAATNPGVWCHSLHDLMDRTKFTSWDQYLEDQVL